MLNHKNMKKELNSFEYKQILLETMDIFDSFCRSNNLTYYLIGGSLLGGIRHKGFIPWDDDIDVGMPRKDYDIFVSMFKGDNTIRFIDCFNTNNYYLPYGKLCNYKVDLHENINSKLHIGAYLDIFPLDFIRNPNDKKLKRILEPNRFIKMLTSLKYTPLNKKTNIIKNTIILTCRMLCPFSLNKIARIKTKRAKKIASLDETNYICCLFGIYGLKEIVDYNFFSKTIEVDFEGRKYLAPCGYDGYLKHIYGDYMRLPPEEKRVTHHGFTVFWSRDFKEQ